MAKKEEIKLDPKQLDSNTVPYPCEKCKGCPHNQYYKSCPKWKKWFSLKRRETTTELKTLDEKMREE